MGASTSVLSLPEAVGLVLFLALSAFFSGSETALFSLRRSRVEELAHGERGRRGRAVAQLLARPHDLLVTILFGNLVVSVSLFASLALMAFRLEERGEAGLAAAVGVGGLAVVVALGEVVPKSLAVVVAEPVALWTAPLLVALVWALRPILASFLRVSDAVIRAFVRGPAPPHVTADELKMLVQLSEEQGLIGAEEQSLLVRVVELGEMSVREVMLPRADMPFFELGRPREELIALARRSRREVIPVARGGETSGLFWRNSYSDPEDGQFAAANGGRPHRAQKPLGGADAVVGVVRSARVLLEPERPLTELVEPVALVPESWTVDELLREFRRRGLSVAVVVDEYGGTSGLLRLSDLIQAVVGRVFAGGGSGVGCPSADGREFQSGSPPAVMVEQVGPGSFLLDARLSIRAWASSLAGFGAGMPVPVRQLADWGPGRPVTVGGLVTTLLGRWPVVGDQVGCPSADGQRNLRFTVTEMHGRRLVKVRVDVLAEGSTEAS